MGGHVAELEASHTARHRTCDSGNDAETAIGGAQAVGPVEAMVGQGVDKRGETDVLGPFCSQRFHDKYHYVRLFAA